MGWIVCPKISVRNYHYSLHNNQGECSSQLIANLEMPNSQEKHITVGVPRQNYVKPVQQSGLKHEQNESSNT